MEKERQMERQKKETERQMREMEDNISQIKKTEREHRNKLTEERKLVR